MIRATICVLGVAISLAACDEHGAMSNSAAAMNQTHFPGMVTAGGGTSGEVMAREGGPRQPGPAGTPGIPLGAEGNTGGAQLGGTQAAANNPAAAGAAGGPRSMQAAPAASAPATSASSAAAAASAAAQREAQDLAQAQDATAARWKKLAASHSDWHLQTAAANGQPAPGAAGVSQIPLRSQKAGTAPPTPDARQPHNAPTFPSVKSKSPDAVKPPRKGHAS